MSLKYKDFISLKETSKEEIQYLLEDAEKLKQNRGDKTNTHPLYGKDLGLLFEKPSTRTRISFEVGVRELGGNSLFMSDDEIQLGRGETVGDTSRTLSLYLDGVIARVYSHSTIKELSSHSSIPVINGLSDFNHPCQAISDVFTLFELNKLEEKFAWVGDGNNVCHSLLYVLPKLGMNMVIATPAGYEPDQEVINEARKYGEVEITNQPKKAIESSGVVYTDQWVSMGDEKDKTKNFERFQINKELLSFASSDVVFMHCLPAKRGQEVTDEIIDGDKSIVWRQAENRLHAQKAILKNIYS